MAYDFPGIVLLDRCSERRHANAAKAAEADGATEHGQRNSVDRQDGRASSVRGLDEPLSLRGWRSGGVDGIVIGSGAGTGGAAELLGSRRRHASDAQCCIDAIQLSDGALKWSSCFDHSAVCRAATERRVTRVIVGWLLLGAGMAAVVLLPAACCMDRWARGRTDDGAEAVGDAEAAPQSGLREPLLPAAAASDKSGQPADANGQLADANGQLADANGQLADANGQLADANGQLADLPGQAEAAKLESLLPPPLHVQTQPEEEQTETPM
eukprot:365662-Chlamydomonas_euryale.AAC.5